MASRILTSFNNGWHTFFGTSQEVAASTSVSEKIVLTTVGLASDTTGLAPLLKELKEMDGVSSKRREAVYAKLYQQIERFLIEHDPVQVFTVQEIRNQVSSRLNLPLQSEGLSLLFVDPLYQAVKLAVLILQDIDRYTAHLHEEDFVSEHIAKLSMTSLATWPEGLESGSPFYRDLQRMPLNELRETITVFSKLFHTLYIHLERKLGAEETSHIFERAYFSLKEEYHTFLPEGLAQLAAMMPEQLLEEEKIGLMSRETLEAKVRERTRELERAKAEIEAEKQLVEKRVIERTQEVREERARLLSSLSSIDMGFIITDKDLAILTMNNAAFRLLQLKTSDPLKRPQHTGELAGSVADIDAALDGLADLKKVCTKVLEHCKGKRLSDVHFQEKFIRISVSPVLAGEKHVLGTVIILEDMTEERVLNRSKDEFFSIASHELRTPLTAIRGNAKLLEDYYADKLKDKNFSEMITDIHDSSIRLIAIVNDFLDVSRIEQGGIQYTKEIFGLRKIAESVAYSLSGLLREKGISISLEFPNDLPDVVADNNRTSQIVYNLVGNAIKFTDQGKITVSAKAVGHTVELYVIDTGKGVSRDNQALLFRKFQQASDNLLVRDATQGTGLGLFISRSLARGMGGDLELIRSELGKGSTFRLTLPLHKST